MGEEEDHVWTNPSDIMKKRRFSLKKRLNPIKKVDIKEVVIKEVVEKENKTSLMTLKRKNPFSCNRSTNVDTTKDSATKKIKINSFNIDENVSLDLQMNSINKDNSTNEDNDNVKINKEVNMFDCFNDFHHNKNDYDQKEEIHKYNNLINTINNNHEQQPPNLNNNQNPTQHQHLHHHLPIDISLKGRLRFSIPTQSTNPPIHSLLSIKGNEEAGALRFYHSECYHNNKNTNINTKTNITDNNNNKTNSNNNNNNKTNINNNNNNIKIKLHSLLSYYTYPHLPWLSTFPRITKHKHRQQETVFLPKEAQDNLYSEWCSSMESCFQTVKQRDAPFMYVCSHICTILFIRPHMLQSDTATKTTSKCDGGGGGKGGGGDGGKDEGDGDKNDSSTPKDDGVIMALVTPTTKGFRKSLQTEGIEFSLPLFKKKKKRSVESPSSQLEVGDDDENKRNDNNGVNDDGRNKHDDDKKNASHMKDDVECKETEKNHEEKNNNVNNIENNNNVYNMQDSKDVSCTKEFNNKNGEKEENNKEDDVDDEEEEEDDEDWLERLGILKSVHIIDELSKESKEFTSDLQRSSPPSSLSSDGDYRRIDYRPESVVMIKGMCEVNAFFNHVMNLSSLTPSTGPLASIPPTILSPSPFYAASLHNLKLSNKGEVHEGVNNKYKSNNANANKSMTLFEVTGPVMPMVLKRICHVLSDITPEFSVMSFVSSNTTAFNCGDGDDFNVKGCLLDGCCCCDRFLGSGDGNGGSCVGSEQVELFNTALKETTYKNGLYSWKASS